MQGHVQFGDIIIGADDTPITNGDDLLNILDTKQPGDKIKLEIANKGSKRSVTVTLGLAQ